MSAGAASVPAKRKAGGSRGRVPEAEGVTLMAAVHIGARMYMFFKITGSKSRAVTPKSFVPQSPDQSHKN